MYPSKNYHAYTNYHLEPAGLRRLDFFVHAVEQWCDCHPNVIPRILDVGCGNGNISLPLASKGWQVSGVDMDRASIAEAKEKNTFSNAIFSVADVTRLPATERVDVVVASEFLEHLEDPSAFLSSVCARLTDGGLLLISVPFGYSVEELLRRFFQHTIIGRRAKRGLRKSILKHEAVQSHAESPHAQFFTWSKLEQLFHASGFTIRERKNSSIMFKEFYYLFGRFFMTRGSRTFQMLDTFDNALAEHLPLFMGDGWLFACAKSNGRTNEPKN